MILQTTFVIFTANIWNQFKIISSEGVCPQGYDILSSGMTILERKVVTESHNDLRMQIVENQVPGQPPGKNLYKLGYDLYLEEDAMFAAKTCVVQHIFPEHPHYEDEGQNIYWQTSSKQNCTPDWPRACNKWFGEHIYYSYESDDSINGQIVGHYTQVVWASTQYLGCNFVCFDNPENLNRRYNRIHVCNYNPGGNIRGEKPYKQEGDCLQLCDPKMV